MKSTQRTQSERNCKYVEYKNTNLTLFHLCVNWRKQYLKGTINYVFLKQSDEHFTCNTPINNMYTQNYIKHKQEIYSHIIVESSSLYRYQTKSQT